ncbi:TPA: hypothetical protein ACGG79_003669 [Vibrio cholerae]
MQLSKHNKRFKRDSQRVAFLPCVGFCDYDVMRKLCNGVGSPLTGRYKQVEVWALKESEKWKLNIL